MCFTMRHISRKSPPLKDGEAGKFSLLLILLMELINSAIEAVIDRISDEYHELSKKAKDIGSLIVLLAFMNAIFIWGICFYQLYC